MTSPNSLLAGYMALDDKKLTHSQRQRCMALFAMQNHPFGMLSQLLYSQALEKENLHTQTIATQQKEIDKVNTMKDFLLSEHQKMNSLVLQKQKEALEIQQLLFDEVDELNDAFVVEEVSDDLLNQLQQAERLNKMLLQTLHQAVREIQRLITMSN